MITSGKIKDIVTISKLSVCGISEPSLDEKYILQIKRWLDCGYHAEMEWMKRTKDDRMDIRKRIPWVKSVLVVLDNYFSEPISAKNGIKFSRYAMGRDYHNIVKEKLTAVLVGIKDIDKRIKGEIYVDTGPVPEKAYAEQAGMGWIGKNGVFIGNGIGSYCFIGILFLSVNIKPSEMTAGRCGSCTLCIDRCPAGAIIEPGLIDSNKCISYLTIEKKGDFSDRDAAFLDKWVYGCDVCQEACPWNRKWSKTTFEPRYIDRKDQIQKYIELGNAGNIDKFTKVFKNTAIERLKFKRIQRNMNAALQWPKKCIDFEKEVE
ncbi:MAG: tRNA epoxyqueuosine(34) reductase QueG [Candidatus Marinimicrobia bacterium]|nr:tRNA epoxyqueuosine(34) reductase QueG [Candidatus Neomarinimicrobiota bacterium]